jgi:formate hydrogenlyase transcriptional activator
MMEPVNNTPALASCQQYQTLLAVAEAIVAHRDLKALLHDLAGRLREVVRFDLVALVRHDAKSDLMYRHVLDHAEPLPVEAPESFPVADDPGGLVLKTQQPLVLSSLEEMARWPRWLERVRPLGPNSICFLPLTTARQRLGTLVFASKTPGAYDDMDVEFLRRVAKQVAVAFENALAFECIEKLKHKLETEKVYLEEEIRTDNNFEEIVGESATLRRVLKDVETVAPTESTVLIHGETGTGKELIARAVHQLSPSRQRTFVKLNCAAIPSGLLESELFGHEKGAFTGAIAQKVGRFELAHEGTLFLDEVGDIPLELQPKLLRVLQEQEFERLGSTRTIRVRVRMVAATNRDLPAMVRDGQFRSDLYYRLNVFPLLLPPLRDRPEDIPRLARHFTQKFARRMGRQIETIPADTMDALVGYAWPGNVRELENVIERAVILSRGTTLQIPVADLKTAALSQPSAADGKGKTVNSQTPRNQGARSTSDGTGHTSLADAEREHILRTLNATQWVLGGPKGAAALLGMKRTTLQSKMKKLGISRPQSG